MWEANLGLDVAYHPGWYKRERETRSIFGGSLLSRKKLDIHPKTDL